MKKLSIFTALAISVILFTGCTACGNTDGGRNEKSGESEPLVREPNTGPPVSSEPPRSEPPVREPEPEPPVSSEPPRSERPVIEPEPEPPVSEPEPEPPQPGPFHSHTQADDGTVIQPHRHELYRSPRLIRPLAVCKEAKEGYGRLIVAGFRAPTHVSAAVDSFDIWIEIVNSLHCGGYVGMGPICVEAIASAGSLEVSVLIVRDTQPWVICPQNYPPRGAHYEYKIHYRVQADPRFTPGELVITTQMAIGHGLFGHPLPPPTIVTITGDEPGEIVD